MGITQYKKELEEKGYTTVRVKNTFSSYGEVEYFAFKDGETFEFGFAGLLNKSFLSKRNLFALNRDYSNPIIKAFERKGIVFNEN